MKKINFLTYFLAIGSLFSCGNSNSDCEFNKLTVTVSIDGEETQKKDGNDCYFIVKEGEGLLTSYTIKGKQTSEVFSVSYFEEPDKVKMENGEGTILRFLDINLNGKKSQWRANKGHKLFKIEKQDTLAFMFMEEAKKEKSVSGTIVFSKQK